MDGGGLVRSVKVFSLLGTVQGVRSLGAAWRRRRAGSAGFAGRGPERARVPGSVVGAEPAPGGGTVCFERSRLVIRVTVSGAVFLGWDGAEPTPSYGVAGRCPEADARAVLEPDKDGGLRVVSERATVAVSRHGAVTVCTPGGVLLRRALPPRWWEPVGGGEARWVQRSEVAADARFFGLGGRATGPRLRDGTYALWNDDQGGAFGPVDGPSPVTMPVQLVVADAGTHLVFHDSTWGGTVKLREGREGAGSGHDRPGTSELRMGGPLRCWVVVGTPARVLHTWTRLTGAPAVPPSWALGHHYARGDLGGEEEVRRVVADHRERGLPLAAVHVASGRLGVRRGSEHWLAEGGVRLVGGVIPQVEAVGGNAVFDGGRAIDAFVRDVRGRRVRGPAGSNGSVYPDFTSAGVRKWWGGLYEEGLAQGFSGFRHDLCEPASLPCSARHALEGRGGDHREAHNVYALCMARAGDEGLRELRPRERPFLVSRGGWVGLQRYGGVWCGGGPAGWPGLRAALSLVIGLGLCGVPYVGSDAGGSDGDPSPELLLRRLQLGAYLPLFRTCPVPGAGRRELWDFGDEVLGHARVALRERERLSPYFVSLAYVARRTGAPYVRPLWWGAPEDRGLRDCEDAFLLGDCLLVAPVLGHGVRRRSVRLPEGRWYDTATGTAFDGPGEVAVDAPLARIPVLARAGAVVPVRGERGGTELEVWAPEAGRTGGGLVVRDAGDGDGWAEPVAERYRVRRVEGRVVVEGDGDGGAPPYAVRVRGL
ncbi:glycoside hydrolase family 31 protein [Streptomyces sp. NPDC046939]|uniref:glycoside hydrolase family 31 protein n=1 Tax=Streptomyces sp. NPDC046939 TaxID=3155376 RepID=UPI0033FC3B6A